MFYSSLCNISLFLGCLSQHMRTFLYHLHSIIPFCLQLFMECLQEREQHLVVRFSTQIHNITFKELFYGCTNHKDYVKYPSIRHVNTILVRLLKLEVVIAYGDR